MKFQQKRHALRNQRVAAHDDSFLHVLNVPASRLARQTKEVPRKQMNRPTTMQTSIRSGKSAMQRSWLLGIVAIFFCAMVCLQTAVGQDVDDKSYSAQIRANTTEPYLSTGLVDHLPKSSTVPTPQQFLGYIVGAPGHLTYSKDIYAYYRALAKASPRVKVFSAGKTEEGREFLMVAVSSNSNIAQLDSYQAITAKLADPRTISDDQAHALEQEGKPFYWASWRIGWLSKTRHSFAIYERTLFFLLLL
jgi:hypothetical protein